MTNEVKTTRKLKVIGQSGYRYKATHHQKDGNRRIIHLCQTGVERRPLLNKQNRIGCTPMHCLPLCERPKNVIEGRG